MKRLFAWLFQPTRGPGGCVVTVLFVSGIAALLPLVAALTPGSPA